MIACPPAADLERYCAAELPADLLDEIDAHVSDCPTCSDRLDRLSRSALRGGPLDGFTPSAEASPPLVPGYELLEKLGSGGMGIVWKARQTSLGRHVALKFLGSRTVVGDELSKRFRVEAESVARLDHPNVVRVYEFNLAADWPFFSMELVDGGTLAGQLAAGPWPIQKAAAIVESVARAVHFAHTRGVLHRDLKPGNILLAGDGTPKVADFGLAKRLDEDDGSTRTGQQMGTPAYMSPEQARGRVVGVPTDVYALGAVLFHLLTGRPPFVGGSAGEVVDQVLTRDPIPPRRLRPSLPRDLETICLRCLDKEPGRRFVSCADLAEDLRRFQAGETILSRPAGRVEKLWRWGRRNPTRAGLYATVAAVLTGGLAFAWYDDAQARARRAAEGVRNDSARTAIVASLDQTERSLRNDRPAETEIALADSGRRLTDDPHADPDGALAAHRDELAAQLRLLRALERIRDRQWTILGGAFDVAAARQDYPRAFREIGVDLSNPQETAERVRNWAIREQVVAALDSWLFAEPTRHGLPVLLAALDPDPDRDAWRASIAGADKDRQRQAAMRLSQTQPPARFLAAYGESFPPDLGRTLLRSGWERNSVDFPLTFALARFLSKGTPAEQEEAIGFYHASLSLRPNHAPTLINLAMRHHAKGERDEAVRLLRRAAALPPPRPEAFFNLGFLFQKEGKLPEAADAYRAALAINPRLTAAAVNLGIVHMSDGDMDAAERSFRAALEIEPNDLGALFNLGLLLKDQKRGEALTCFTRFTELAPADRRSWCNVGLCLRSQGKYDDAIAALEKAREFKHPGADGLIEETLDMRKKYPLVQAALAGNYRPKSAEEFMYFIGICKDLGRYRDAVKLFDDNPKYLLPSAAAAVFVRMVNGEGIDPPEAAQRDELRRAALSLLRDELGRWQQRLGEPDDRRRQLAVTALQGWLKKDDFASVRHLRALERLPPSDRKAWEDFWDEVRQTLKKAREES